MTMNVAIGDDKDFALAQDAELLGLKMGTLRKSIPLNGGSQTRRDIREYWRQWAQYNNVAFEANGCMVTLGGQWHG